MRFLGTFLVFLIFSINVVAQACFTTWNASAVYASPTSVSHNGRNYTSKWWTQGNQPGSDPSGVWADNGACSSCSSVNPGSIGSAQSIVANATPNALTSISGASGGDGSNYSYQWQVSTNNSSWADISGATSTSYAPGALTANTYYRRKASSAACGDGYTTSILVSIIIPIDSDGDGVFNHIDLDNDNDGILDIQECPSSNFQWSGLPVLSGNIATGSIGNVNYTYNSSAVVQTTGSIYNLGAFPSSYGIPNTTSIANFVKSNNTLIFDRVIKDPVLVFASIGSAGNSVPIKFGAPVEILFSTSVTQISSSEIQGEEGYAIVRLNGSFSQLSFEYLKDEGWVNFYFGVDFTNNCDTDGDGIDNTLDLDSDGDGCSDAVEGGAAFTSSNISSDKLSGGVDANGVPLSATASGQSVGNSANAAVSDPTCPPCPDNDADGVCDQADLDDDNDGILDVTECPSGNFQWSTPPTVSGTNTATGTINGFVNYTYTSDQPVQTETVFQGIGSFPAQYNFAGGTNVMNTQVSSNTITFSQPVTDPILAFGSIGAGGFPVGIIFSNPVEILWSQDVVQNSTTQITGSEGHTIVKLKGVFTQFSFNYLVSEFRVNFAFGADFTNDCDIDNDGIANSLDFDSDGDGCSDAVEGGAAFKSSDLSGQRLAGSVDSKGVPVVATASGQAMGSSQNVNVQDVECCIKPTVSTSGTKVCVGATITANPTTGGTWTSSNNSVATISNAGVITGITAGTATFTFTNTGGCSSTTNSVTVNTKPQVTLIDAEICAGDPAATFDAGAGFASYTWSNNGSGNVQTTSGTNTGLYTVIVADANGCKDTANANLTLKANCGCVNDNDKDGVCDIDDLDDDNDGILDVVECADNSASWDFETPVVGGGNNNQGTAFQGWTCSGGGWINLIRPPYGDPASTAVPQTAASGNQYVEVGGTGDFSRVYSVASAGVVSVEIDFASWAAGTEQTQINIFKSDGITLVAQSPIVTTIPVANWSNAWQNKGRVSALLQPGDYVIKFSLGNFQAFDNVKISSATLANCDTDNDGIVNSLDTDSDGDGCSDAIEGGGAFKTADLNGLSLSGAVDANGVPVVAGASGQTVGASANSAVKDVDCINCDIKPVSPEVNGVSSSEIYSFVFDAQKELNETTPILKAGKQYKFKVTGTWSVWTTDPNNHPLDAAYRFADKMTGIPIGTPIEGTYVKLNGATHPKPEPNQYNALHEYWYNYTGAGQALNFTFSDSYGDNHGTLTYTFYSPIDTIIVCASSTITSLGQFVSGTNLLWYTSETGGVGSATSPNVNNAVEALYTHWVSQTVNSCESDRSPLIYKINIQPKITISDTAICEGESFVFDAGPGFASYAWSGAKTATTQSIAATSAGIYKVIVTSSAGCADTAEATVTVNTKPNVVLSNVAICEGDAAATFDAGSGYSSYIWSENGTGNSQATSGKIAGNYTVKVVDAKGCKDTSSASLTVNTKPIVILTNAVICEGDAAVTFDAGAGYSSYIWSENGTGNSQTTSGKIAGNYTVKVVDAKGCKDTSSAALTVNAKPNVVLSNVAICEGDAAATFDAGQGFTSYIWSDKGTGNSQSASGKIGGSYTVKVVDANGCKDTASATLTVNAKPNVILNNAVICEGDAAIVFDAGAGYSSYLWSDIGTGNTQKTSGTNAGTYTVNVVDAKGCKDTASATLTINTKPNVSLSSAEICEGDTVVTFDAGAGYSSYLWSDNGTGNTQKTNGTIAGTYMVKVVDAKGCKDTASAILKVNKKPTVQFVAILPICKDFPSFPLKGATPLGGVYEVEDGSNWKVDSVFDVPSKPKGNYKIRYTYKDANACANTVSASVVVNDFPKLQIEDQQICEGHPAVFDAGSNFINYRWSTGSNLSKISAAKEGVYSVSVIDHNGCRTSDTMVLKVNALPIVDLGESQKICSGEIVTLESSTIGDNYLWNDGSKNKTLQVKTTGTYSLNVIDSNLCVGTDHVEISVIPLPKVNLGSDQEICEGKIVSLSVKDPKASYYWSTGEKKSTISVGATNTITLAQYYDADCLVKDSVRVTVLPFPKLELGNDTTLCLSETFDGALILNAGSLADSYLWSTGSTNSTISIDARGTYSVSLTNGKSCTVTDQITIDDLCKTSLFCPSAFTPNNDGNNDVFYVKGANADYFQLLIFNRWGDVVFESDDMNKGWDGTVNENIVQQDVYVVKVIYSINREKGYKTKEQIISSLTLIR